MFPFTPPGITTIPPEVLRSILLPLEQRDRLALVRSHRHIELAVARNIRWFIPLLVPPPLRNVAMAVIHAPRRGAREHVRQFRSRVKAFVRGYHDRRFQDVLPDPFARPDGSLRGTPHPRVMARFRDLLSVLAAIDRLMRDHVGKMGSSSQVRTSALDSLPKGVDEDTLLGVGVSMAPDRYGTYFTEGYQVSVLASFLRLELFRRLFYSNPLQPLWSSGDATPLQFASREGCLPPGAAAADGFTTQWDYGRRARVWQGDFTRLDNAWKHFAGRALAQLAHNGGRGICRHLQGRLDGLRPHLKRIARETESTVSAFKVLWTQYAIWIDNEFDAFRSAVSQEAAALASREKQERQAFSRFHDALRPLGLPASLLSHLARQEDQRRQDISEKCFKVGADHDFVRHNMTMILPEVGDEARWPDMFRFLTFVTSLGLPFFNRCVAMDDKQRRRTFQSIYLFLVRLPPHRIPQFVIGELDHRHPDQVAEFPMSDVRYGYYLHPIFSLHETNYLLMSRVSAHLSRVGSRSSWTFLNNMVVSKESWEKILDKHATDVITDREELPFGVSDGQWKQMRRPRNKPRSSSTPCRPSDCTPFEYARSYEWALEKNLIEGDATMDNQFRRARAQFHTMQLLMDSAGGAKRSHWF